MSRTVGIEIGTSTIDRLYGIERIAALRIADWSGCAKVMTIMESTL